MLEIVGAVGLGGGMAITSAQNPVDFDSPWARLFFEYAALYTHVDGHFLAAFASRLPCSRVIVRLRRKQTSAALTSNAKVFMKSSSTLLKAALLREYGSFSDKRIKNVERGSKFIIDDRVEGGLASDGNPYGWFCTVVADVMDAHSVRVTLNHNVPQGESVMAWANAYGVGVSKGNMTFTVKPNTIALLTTLANAFLAIVAPEAPRYNVPGYKYSCPRTAATLTRLAEVLMLTWPNY